MPAADDLSSLTEVEPRSIWPGEATDFTPWLLAHADALGEALGIDLDFETSEHRVGGFSLDLIGRNLDNDKVVIVENQLEATDHTHLGQILTYAAGTDAGTIVWIATRFREEHRQALDWFNETTNEDVHFFGVRLRVVRIADSPPAPLFEIVASPNDWQKQVRATTRSGGLDRQELYVSFWSKMLERLDAEHPDWTQARIPQGSNWMDMPSGVPQAHYSMSFGRDGLRHSLYINHGDAEQNAEVLERLLAKRAELEEAFGGPLEFEPAPGRKYSSVYCLIDGDIADTAAHPRYIDWFIDARVRFRRAFTAIGEETRICRTI